MRRTKTDIDLEYVGQVLDAGDYTLAQALLNAVLTEEMTTDQEALYNELFRRIRARD